MSQFVAVASVDVRHSYTLGGLCRELVFEPDSATVRLLQQNRLIVKSTESGFLLIAEQAPSFSNGEDLVLRFNVYSADPLFAAYTQELQEQELPLYFVLEGPVAAKKMLLPVTGTQRKNALTKEGVILREQLRKPVLVIDMQLTLDGLEFSSEQVYVPRHAFTIQLHSRAFYWKYFFVGDLARYELEIEDANSDNPVSFSICDEPLSKAMISHEPLSMSLDSPYRFQLKDKNNLGKVLLKRLPNASIRRIGKGKISNGQLAYVAEIYINQ